MTEKRTRQNVTKQKSAEINARLGQLCAIAASAREIGAPAASASDMTAQLNEEFGLDWVEHTYWVRARKAGHAWPGGTVRRLTPEEEEKMDLRLRELCAAGMPGTEIRNTINREMGLDWTLQAYFARAKRLGLPWIDTPKAGRRLTPAEYLPEPQRPACFEDPAYEALHGIADRLICRECFVILRDGAMQGRRGHLWTMHQQMGLRDYRRRNPGARIFTFQRIADDTGRDVRKLMDDEAELYATPEVLAAADSDPKYEVHNDPEHVICRMSRCGFKSRVSLKKHLESQHDVRDVDVYRREHNWAPIIAPHAAAEKAESLRKRNEDKNRKLAAAWRPEDWWEKPMEWRIIGNELLSRQGYMSNEELGQRLDEARMFKCPYGETWQDALSGPKHGSKRAINLVSEIRTWVRRDRASCDENAA